MVARSTTIRARRAGRTLPVIGMTLVRCDIRYEKCHESSWNAFKYPFTCSLFQAHQLIPRAGRTLFLLLVADGVIVMALYLLRALYLQLLIVVFDVSFMTALVAFERSQSGRKTASGAGWAGGENAEYPVEGAEWLNRLPVGERISKEHELRQLRWSAREAETEKTRSFLTDGLLIPYWQSKARGGGREDEFSRRVALKNLKRVIEASIHAAYHEEFEPMRHSLKMMANELKAAYGQMRRRMGDGQVLSDYWVTWAILTSAAAGSPVAPGLAGYSSRGIRGLVKELIRAVNSRVVGRKADLENGYTS